MDAKHFHQFVRDLNGYTEEQFDSLPLSVRTRYELVHFIVGYCWFGSYFVLCLEFYNRIGGEKV